MKLKEFFCLTLCVGCAFSYKVSFPDRGDNCVISSTNAKCAEKCSCANYLTFSPKSWFNLITSAFQRKKCHCQGCQSSKTVRCVNGVCDKKNSKCVCDYCWVGETCNEYQNKYAPKFDSTSLAVSIPRSHPPHLPVATVAARDTDSQYCNNAKCFCGEISYKLHGGNSTFWIDKSTGAISLIRTPLSSFYVLDVSASNYFSDGSNNNEDVHMKVTISFFDDQPVGNLRLSNDEFGSIHHRLRRSLTQNSDIPLVITAYPDLTTSYYFAKGDTIAFKIRAKNNGTSSSMKGLTLRVVGMGLTLSQPKGEGATQLEAKMSGKDVEFSFSDLNSGSEAAGSLSSSVNNDIGPLESLYLNISYKVTVSGQVYTKEGVKSKPTIYGVFPNITLVRSSNEAVQSSSLVNMEMTIILPVMSFHLLVELTTNVECFIFMEVLDVTVAIDGVTATGKHIPKSESSKNSNGLTDRVVIDFGNVSVQNGNQNSIKINYKIKIYDHINVGNGSTHYAGVGVQTGESVLWVKQQDFFVIKNDAALGVIVDRTKIVASRLFIGDEISIPFEVGHTSTSEGDAKNVKIGMVAEMLKLAPSGNDGVTAVNDTYFEKDLGTLNRGSVFNGTFKMVVQNTVTPLMSIPVKYIIKYENTDLMNKFPTVQTVQIPIVGSPNITFFREDGSTDIVFGSQLTFRMSILLTKMRSPIRIEIVMPKVNNSANGTALMSLLDFNLVSIGVNIKNATINKPVFFNTSDDKEGSDQATLDLGILINDGGSDTNTSENQINIKFTAIVNEVQNVANGEAFEVAAGLIAKPKMVWIGRIGGNVNILSDRAPKINLIHEIYGEGDFYNHYIYFNHTSSSDQYAYNVTFEYFLPPYVEFQNVASSSSGVNKVDISGGRSRFMLETPLKFLDSAWHNITVKINKAKLPKSGTFDFVVPVALTCVNYEKKKWQYWRSVRRSITSYVNSPFIERKPNAHQNYYGRGIFLDDARNTMYVCMNMHLPSSRPACYKSTDTGIRWTALDSRVGSVIGHKDNHLYAVTRNQLSVIKLDMSNAGYDEYEWLLIPKSELQSLVGVFTGYKDLSGATATELPAVFDAAHKIESTSNGQWGGTDGWLYYRATDSDAWEKRAKWRL